MITGALAQNYPTKPVRLIVPFPPGGGTDIVARVIAVRATESLGQSVVVDNRAGGGGTIGAETAVRANPDGYTLAMVSASYATNPALYKLPYDAVKDIQAIVMIGQSGWVLALNPAVPIKSRQGVRRLQQGESRQAQLRIDRNRRRHASRHRALRSDGGHEDDPHPVQGHRPGA